MKTLGFSDDVTEMSKAAGLPRAQLGNKMLAGPSGVRLLPSPPSHSSGLYGNSLLTITQSVVAWGPRGSSELAGHRAHWEPLELSKPSHWLPGIPETQYEGGKSPRQP